MAESSRARGLLALLVGTVVTALGVDAITRPVVRDRGSQDETEGVVFLTRVRAAQDLRSELAAVGSRTRPPATLAELSPLDPWLCSAQMERFKSQWHVRYVVLEDATWSVALAPVTTANLSRYQFFLASNGGAIRWLAGEEPKGGGEPIPFLHRR